MELAGLNIKFLPGVGEKKAAVLYEELQVQSYEDMLYHVPFKYIDRSKIYSINTQPADLLLLYFRDS